MLVNTQLFIEPEGYYVYKYSYKGEPFYIGLGKGNRAIQHMFPSKIKSREHIFFYNKLNRILRLGEKPDIEIIESNLSKESAKVLEVKLIKEIGRRDLNLGPLCNLTNGGEGHSGYVKSEELKRRISNWSKGKKLSEEHINRLRQANLGRKLTEETKRKISLVQKGIKKKSFTKEHIENMSKASKLRCSDPKYLDKLRARYIRRVLQFSIDGVLIKEWDSHLDAAKECNGRSARILSCCKGLVSTHKDFKWKYAD